MSEQITFPTAEELAQLSSSAPPPATDDEILATLPKWLAPQLRTAAINGLTVVTFNLGMELTSEQRRVLRKSPRNLLVVPAGFQTYTFNWQNPSTSPASVQPPQATS